jgi:hypothetical protein
MALCGSRSCGCALRSDSLSISGSGTRDSPWNIEVVAAANQLIETSHADFAALTAAYPSPVDGQTGWLRTPKQRRRWNTVEWLVMEEPWTAYTPAWTTTGTPPTLNNGTLTGKYSRVGKICHFRINLTIGSSTSVGTGDWRWTLPFASVAGPEQWIPVEAWTGTIRVMGVLGTGGGTVVGAQVTGASSPQIASPSNTYPSAWVTGGNIIINGSYEMA